MTAVAVPGLSPPRSAEVGRRGAALRVLANPRSSLCLAALLLAGVVGLDALSDPDLWWHLRVGQWMLTSHQLASTEFFTYTVAGTPRVPQHWLSSLLFAVVFSHGGLFLLALLVGVASWSGFVAIALRGRALGAGALTIAIGTVLGAKAAEPVLGVRPQVLTFALLCWTLWLTDGYLRRGGRRIWLLPLLFLLWANLHAGFVAGLGSLAVIAVAEVVRSYRNRGDHVVAARTRSLLLATALASVATLVNPVGPRIFTYVWGQGVGEAAKGIAEWQHPNFADPAMWTFGVVLVSLVVLLVRRPRIELRELLLAAAGVAIGLWAVRNIAISAALLMPLWMTSASQLGRDVSVRMGWRPSFPVTRRGVAVGGAMVALAAAVLASSIGGLYASSAPAGVAAVYPSCAASVLARSPVQQRVFALYSSAGYLVYRLWPQAAVYLYGDSEAENLAVFQSYYRIAAGATASPSATQLLQASDTTAVLFPRGALTAQLDQQPGWTRVVDDHGLLLYVRGAVSWTRGVDCAG